MPRFSCMLFLDVRGVFDHAASRSGSRCIACGGCCLPTYANRVGTRFVSFRGSIARPADAPIYASPYASRRTTQDSRSE
jgi:hypothetical protein